MAEATNSDNEENEVMADCSYNKEPTMQNAKKKVLVETEIESSLQPSLMFSLQSRFKQHPVLDNHRIMSSENESSKSSTSLLASRNTITYQGIQQKRQYSEALAAKKDQSQTKIQVLDEISFEYDSAFKKPHFMKHSVFEDDIAVFKDESSPMVLSTAASSLSSLTIDDDECGENISPNKAGLMKKNCNPINVLHVQKSRLQESWHQKLVENANMSSQNSSSNQATQLYNNQQRLPVYSDKNQIVNEQLIKSSNTESYDEQQSYWKSQKYTRYPEQFSNDINNSNLNLSSNEYYKDKQRSRIVDENCRERTSFTTNAISQSQQMTHLNNCNKQDDGLTDDEEYFEDQKDPRQLLKEVFHNTDDTELNSYEEELLDQCIRKGIAKVTRRDINELKPFCWDLDRICLTTRAMLKPVPDEELKEKKEERMKRRLSYKGLTKFLTHSRVK
ncbi:uncharacterized protein LOC116416124 [Nasonia vitripennis]|uniref:Uncharacterized protein n=1 Tax=Nasonia vitripennis TaxID=7425 RepID=A0A7M7PYE6_NASVI|nr:uncharacterized protein LOC116416124 [Nasonia vitripennis]